MSHPTLTMYYDGLCPLCSREIAHYRGRTKDDPSVQYVDIADPAFDAAAHGLDAGRVHKAMHVKVGDELHTGPDAFLAVWKRVRGFGWLARLVRLPVMYQLWWLGYHAFATVRPWLPRRKADCSTGACRR
jgi:predicted DCC family thiol-disulfide oxidoreductase YuxK